MVCYKNGSLVHFVLQLDSFPALLHMICCSHTARNHIIYANCESIEFHALRSGKLDSSVNVQIPWPPYFLITTLITAVSIKQSYFSNQTYHQAYC